MKENTLSNVTQLKLILIIAFAIIFSNLEITSNTSSLGNQET